MLFFLGSLERRLLVINELFTRCYGRSATREYRFKISVFCGNGSGGPKYQVQGVIPHQPFFLSENYINVPFMCEFRQTFFPCITIHAFHRRQSRILNTVVCTMQRGKSH